MSQVGCRHEETRKSPIGAVSVDVAVGMDDDTALLADAGSTAAATPAAASPPMQPARPRSLSDSDGAPGKPKLSPSPLILQTTKDDSSLGNASLPPSPNSHSHSHSYSHSHFYYSHSQLAPAADLASPRREPRPCPFPTLSLMMPAPRSFSAVIRDDESALGSGGGGGSNLLSLTPPPTRRPSRNLFPSHLQGRPPSAAGTVPQLPAADGAADGAESGAGGGRSGGSSLATAAAIPSAPASPPPAPHPAATSTATPKPNPSTPISDKFLDSPLEYSLDYGLHTHSQTYTSPSSILPRRSRGLDFSRAATSLHHSTLAEQSSADSSPTTGHIHGYQLHGRQAYQSSAAAFPGRIQGGDLGSVQLSSQSPTSPSGNRDRLHISTSLGPASNHYHCRTGPGSDSSSSEDDYDPMDEDVDEPYVGTPQASGPQPASSLAAASLGAGAGLNYQQRRRPKKLPRKRLRAPLGLGFSTPTAGATSRPRSPPRDRAAAAAAAGAGHGRRESISWHANRLQISAGSESEEGTRQGKGGIESATSTPGREGHRDVIRRAVTRRGSLLPKTKNFARIRAALAEEGAPVEAEFRREAEVVRQVRESDVGLERPAGPERPAALDSLPAGSSSSPDDMPELDMMAMATDATMSLSAALRQRAIRNPKARSCWDSCSETSSIPWGGKGTPPPPPAPMPCAGSEDMAIDPPSGAATMGPGSGSDSQRAETPPRRNTPPTAAEITRRINKRRRDDDLDPVGVKRRAVSPGISVHNSPVMQSPMHRDPWGSRPGSNGGDSQRSGSTGAGGTGAGGTGGTGGGNKGRVGYQGMVDTSDGMNRMSIE